MAPGVPRCRAARPLRRRDAAWTVVVLAATALVPGAVAPGVAIDWEQVLEGRPMYAVTSAQGGALVLAGGGQLQLSRDGGASWDRVWPWDTDGFFSVAVDLTGEVLYAGGENGVLKPMVLASHDGGVSWEQTGFPDGGDGRVTAIAPHPTEPLVAAAAVLYGWSDGVVVLTVDGGKTWAVAGTGANVQVADVAWTSAGELLAGTALGVGLVKDGAIELVFTKSGEARSIEAAPEGPIYITAAEPEVWRSEGDPGLFESWAPVPDAPADHLAVHPADPDQVWATTAAGALVRCGPGGCEAASPPAFTLGAHVASNDQVFAATDSGVWLAST